VASVVILGAGVMGSALAMPLADNGHDVRSSAHRLDARRAMITGTWVDLRKSDPRPTILATWRSG
jgi:glycerol-3-phosphate dehydrogenase